LVTHRDIVSEEFLPEVYVGLFRREHSWEVFAPLRWSAVNYDIGPEVHVAIHKYWQQSYGAEVVSATAEIVQCAVTNPPRSKEVAMTLAREQYLYCPDIVWQGVGTISELAASLMNHDYWYFWWD
jgi:hypothetical protein